MKAIFPLKISINLTCVYVFEIEFQNLFLVHFYETVSYNQRIFKNNIISDERCLNVKDFLYAYPHI